MLRVFRTWMERYFADEEAVLVAVLLVASFVVLVTLGVVLAPMITALIIAFLMQGAVAKMERWGLHHNLAATLAFLLLVGGLVLAFVFIWPKNKDCVGQVCCASVFFISHFNCC